MHRDESPAHHRTSPVRALPTSGPNVPVPLDHAHPQPRAAARAAASTGARACEGSLALLRLSLSDCTVESGEVFDAEEHLHGQPPGTWLLYPGDLLAAPGSDPPGSHPSLGTVQQLVLLDGTWRKTRKLLHLNPWLQQLPRFALPTPPPSRYLIRKAQQADQRSTLEAACLALAALEQRPAHYAPLLQALSNWVREHATLRPS